MYTIKEAALRAGVTVPLLRAWERPLGSRTRDLVGILVVTGHG